MHYSPVRHWYCYPFDLHVLGTPPAFVLSQDQTLKKVFNLFLVIRHEAESVKFKIELAIHFLA